MKKIISILVVLASVLSMLVGCSPRIDEKDLSDARYIRVVSRSLPGQSYDVCTITDEATVRSICDTFLSLELKKYIPSNTKEQNNTSYQYYFVDSRGMSIYEICVKEKHNVISLSDDRGSYTVVSDIDINEYSKTVMYNDRIDAENKKPIPNADLPKASNSLEFWIGENVDDVDFSDYTRKYGLFGGDEYYGTGYTPTKVENGVQYDPPHCVIYTVTAFPDYSSLTSHVTRITITDPNIDVYGLTLLSDKEEIRDKLTAEGFEVVGGSYEVLATKGNYTFRFSTDEIRISVKVTNKHGIIF